MFNLQLDEKHINTILMSLGKQPAEISMESIIIIKRQCESQIIKNRKNNEKPVNDKKTKDHKKS